MKKVLLVYVSAGAGHQKAAEALYQFLKDNHPELELQIIDLLDYTPASFRLFYSKGYIFLISKLPWLWHLLYRTSSLFANNKIFAYLDYLTALPFVDLLVRERPDVVISTHFLTSSILTVFKKKNPARNIKLVSIITDYNLHPLWLGEGGDLYIAACDFAREELLRRNVPADKVRVRGIPAKEKFYRQEDRKQIAAKYGIKDSVFTVLIITGAVGLGPIEEIAKALAGEIQVLAVCGKNKRLYQRLNALASRSLSVIASDRRERSNPKNEIASSSREAGLLAMTNKFGLLKAFPLIDYVDELMSVTDAVITKAGGLTITESLAKGLPMVFFSNIPGLESSNARVLSENGCAFDTSGIEEIKQRVLSLKNNPVFYQQTVSSIIRFRKSQTLTAIACEIKNLLTCRG
ncbi:MAG TPA: glycosyltransferase [Candidatus Omnitrophota bacterium]|nr:glycosyltransferase [Candidatus Omnitrophota bacterium]